MVCKKIGIDFHGVINTDPFFFGKLLTAMIEQNIEVHIISGGPREFLQKYLEQKHIPYTHLWCIFDFYEAKDKVTFNEDGTFFVDDELWNTAKAEYCRREEIDLHIDDSSIYERSFSTPYCRYNAKEHLCCMGGNKVLFSGDPQNVLLRLIEYCNKD